MIFAVIGGDDRQKLIARMLRDDGHGVVTFALGKECSNGADDLREAEYAILPLPTEASPGVLNAPLCDKMVPIESIIPLLTGKRAVFGGKMSETLTRAFEKAGILALDYYDREDLTLENAAITAEGAIGILIERHPKAIYDMKTAVVGCGRIGRSLAEKLRALGSDVTVTARKGQDLTWTNIHSMQALATAELSHHSQEYDAVINTVPAPVITDKVISAMKKGAVIIDLASKPGGTDVNAAEKCGIDFVHALALPGKCAPETSAKAVKNTLYKLINEQVGSG